VCDDYSGYKALFEREVVEVGCLAHARRKFHDPHENHRSQIAADALARETHPAGYVRPIQLVVRGLSARELAERLARDP